MVIGCRAGEYDGGGGGDELYINGGLSGAADAAVLVAAGTTPVGTAAAIPAPKEPVWGNPAGS